MEQVAHATQVEQVEDRAGAVEPVVVGTGGEVVRSTHRVVAARGMVSAEWAVGIIAAVAIAGVLLAVVTTGQVKAALLHVILTVIATFANFAR